MRLLVDANLSPDIVSQLTQAGHDSVHVADVGLLRATDLDILEGAEKDKRVIITADTDFPMCSPCAACRAPRLSSSRGASEIPPEIHAELLVENLPQVSDALDVGAIVTITPTRVRVRDLPIM